MKYAFIHKHRQEFPVRMMCKVFRLHPSGFYAWLHKPVSDRELEDQRLLKLIRKFYIGSGGTYGSPWIFRDLREAGESCSVHRVAKIMRKNGIKAQIGYKRRYFKDGKPARVADNLLNRSLIPTSRTRRGSVTLPMSEPTRDFCMWLRCWIYFPERL